MRNASKAILQIRLGLLTAATLLAYGCGQEFKLPPQPDAGRIPTPGTYNLDRVWEVPSPTDAVLQGSYLFVIEQHQTISVYLSRQKNLRHPDFIGSFDGLIHPTRICLAKRDSTFIFVADEGDTSIKRYYFRGGPPLSRFRDPRWNLRWGGFSGLAADNDLNVYVAGALRDSIYKYDAGGNPVRLVSDHGNGHGYVIQPHGLRYVSGALWVADTGRNRAQRLRPDSTDKAFPGKTIGEDRPLGVPIGIATDIAGERVLVTEWANDRVLRFLATGAFTDTVYSPTRKETRVDPPLRAPRYLAADDSLVFLPDSANNRIVVLRLSTQ